MQTRRIRDNKKNNKKAQLSVFIAIGIVIIMSTGIFFYLQKQTSKFIPEEIVPADILPVREYTKQCIADVAAGGIARMGEQGGYINIPEKILLRRDAAVSLTPNPDSELKLPMWYYGGMIRAPSYEEMSRELENYIMENSADCFNYNPFEDKFNFEEVSDLSVNVTINEKDVVVDVRRAYKVKDKTQDRETDMTQYLVQLPVRLKKVMEIGKKIVEAENEQNYFESLTVDLMSSNEKIPMNNLEFDCGKKVWVLPEVKSELQNMLYSYFSSIRVKNTLHPGFEMDESYYEQFKDKYHSPQTEKWSYDIPLEDRGAGDDQWAANVEKIDETEKEIEQAGGTPDDLWEYFNLYWDSGLTEDDAGESIKVAFSYYPQTGMAMRAYPSEGEILKSNLGKGNQKYLSFMCMNVYHFTYDINYPVEVRVEDSESYGGRGFEMRFAMPVIVRKNLPARKTAGYVPYFGPEYDYNFCEDTLTDATGEEKQYTLTVKDKNDLAYEIPEVNLSFVCLNYECPLGQTWVDESTWANYNLKTGLPTGCQNGFIVAEKTGYLADKRQINSEDTKLELRVREIKKVPFIIKRHLFMKATAGTPWAIDPEPNDLDNEMTANIYYTLDEPNTGFFVTREYSGAKDHYKTISVEKKGVMSVDVLDYLEIPLDQTLTYDLNIMLKNKKGDVIGGYMGPWTVSYDELVNTNAVVLNVIEYRPIATNDDERMDMYTVLATNEQYKKQLAPKFIIMSSVDAEKSE